MKDKKGKVGFSHALAGIIAVYQSEMNFRFHLLVTCIVTISGWIVQLAPLEWVAIMIVIGMVLISELINTSIEKLIDYVKPEIHPQARFIKDAAAGAVFISSIIAVVIGLIIFLPKIFNFLL